MAKLTTPEFVDYLRRSGLVVEDALDHSLDELRREQGGGLPPNADVVVKHLIDAALITRWHADKIFDKKYKGFRLGKYKLLRHLGTGQMSSVYLAEHVLMKQLRAIKVLPKSRSALNSAPLQLFHLEAQAAASLSHPNLVSVYDVDSDGEQHFFVMEFVDGTDLQSLVVQRGPRPLDVACNYIAQAAEGLDYAHRHNIIHCDVKPANLMLDQQGLVRVLDLGLALHARSLQDSLSSTHRHEILSTANYLSPEQAADSRKVDLRTDIYNLGCTLYFLLTGHPPFPVGSFVQRVALHMRTMPVSVSQDRPDCPDDLADICRKMLQKNPDLRYHNMSEVIDALETWLINHGFVFEPGPGDAAVMRAVPLKKSRISSLIQSHPKTFQTVPSREFPEFPVPASGKPANRLFLGCLLAMLLAVAMSPIIIWLIGYW